MPDFGDITEKASDAAIDKAGGAADAKTGGQHEEQVDKVQQAADEKIGE
ncbi:antitoxin [Kineococcus sp. NPDC059986]